MKAGKHARLRIAVIGAGWAGCAAAVELTLQGHAVHLFDAARQPGGRARALHRQRDDWESGLDNGQHILLGAYRESLRMMRAVGVDPRASLLRLPLQMRYPPGSGGMDFQCPRLPSPLHLLIGLLRTTGLAWADKLALARFSTTARWIEWRLNTDCSVTQLLHRFDQTPRVIELLWRPLCLAALNTPPERASAQVFLNVLRDSLGARRAASDMLVPRTDLGQLFPVPATRFIAQRGGRVRLGCRVQGVDIRDGLFDVRHAGHALTTVERAVNQAVQQAGNESASRSYDLQGNQASGALAAERFNCVIVALPPADSARLLDASGLTLTETSHQIDMDDGTMLGTGADHGVQSAPGLTDPAQGEPQSPLRQVSMTSLNHEPITTCYLRYDPGVALELPLFALRDDPLIGHYGQFVFDRGQLDQSQRGILAVVISASADAVSMPADTLGRLIAAQLADVFTDERLRAPLSMRIVSEKRATFSCTPGLVRAAAITGIPGLFLAGDHVAGDYPSTIEGAVRSGIEAARLALQG